MRSDREERDFWVCHSEEEFAKELRDLDVEVRPSRTEQIALRLYTEELSSRFSDLLWPHERRSATREGSRLEIAACALPSSS